MIIFHSDCKGSFPMMGGLDPIAVLTDDAMAVT